MISASGIQQFVGILSRHENVRSVGHTRIRWAASPPDRWKTRGVRNSTTYHCVDSHDNDLGVSMFTASILSGTKRFLEWVQRTR